MNNHTSAWWRAWCKQQAFENEAQPAIIDDLESAEARLLSAENIIRGLIARYDTAILEEARQWLVEPVIEKEAGR